MTLSIGRVGLDVAVDGLEGLEVDGDRLSIRGRLAASSTAAAKALRQQLDGYVADGGDDEPIVPVVWTDDTTVSGYYRVRSAKVSTVPVSYAANWFPFQLELERVASYSTPRVQIRSRGANRVGTPGGVTPVPWSAVPAAATAYGATVTALTPATRTGPGGSVTFRGSSTQTYYDATATFVLPPANYYDAAATLKVGGYVVTGRQIPAADNLTNWELSNGLVKITPSASSTATIDVAGPKFATPSQWSAATAVQIGHQNAIWGWQPVTPTGTYMSGPKGITVVRNTPEEVVIRLATVWLVPVSSQSVAFDFELRLRRGSFFAEIYCSGASTQFGLVLDAASAATTIGAGEGLLRTAAVDGNRLVMLANTTATTRDNVNGKIWLTAAAATAGLAVGLELGGASAAAPNLNTDLRDQFFAAQADRQRVVTA